jgi:hypothetical protein
VIRAAVQISIVFDVERSGQFNIDSGAVGFLKLDQLGAHPKVGAVEALFDLAAQRVERIDIVGGIQNNAGCIVDDGGCVGDPKDSKDCAQTQADGETKNFHNQGPPINPSTNLVYKAQKGYRYNFKKVASFRRVKNHPKPSLFGAENKGIGMRKTFSASR